jgi:hypothetical protein
LLSLSNKWREFEEATNAGADTVGNDELIEN